jgi:hypothetical protein
MSQTIGFKDGDFYVRPNGQLMLIQATDKGESDLVEAFLTPYLEGEGYGNELYLFVGAVPAAGMLMESQVGMMVERCHARLREFQQQDPYLTDDENIAEIVNLNVETLELGSYLYSFTAHTASGNVIGSPEFPFSAHQADPPGMAALEQLAQNLWPYSWLSK